jgi:putative MATE family efflux protein
MTLFTKDRSFYKNLIKLAIPVALQNLITFAVGFADNLMVSKLGDSAVSGVYMGNQIQTFLQVFTVGIEGSILVLATQYWGKKDKSSIKKIVAVGLQFALIFGLVLTAVCAVFPSNIISLFTNETSVIESGASYLRIVCFSYVFFCVTQSLIASMRSVEVVRIGLFVSSVSLFVNVGLNYVLIFGKFGLPEMGINGAAAATLISRAVECAVMIIYVSKIDKRLELRLKDAFQTEKELRRDFIRYGLPIIAGQAVWSINMMANSAILGRFSEEVITAVSVANTMNTLAYVTMNGLSSAVGIITGKTVGAGKKI